MVGPFVKSTAAAAATGIRARGDEGAVEARRGEEVEGGRGDFRLEGDVRRREERMKAEKRSPGEVEVELLERIDAEEGAVSWCSFVGEQDLRGSISITYKAQKLLITFLGHSAAVVVRFQRIWRHPRTGMTFFVIAFITRLVSK